MEQHHGARADDVQQTAEGRIVQRIPVGHQRDVHAFGREAEVRPALRIAVAIAQVEGGRAAKLHEIPGASHRPNGRAVRQGDRPNPGPADVHRAHRIVRWEARRTDHDGTRIARRIASNRGRVEVVTMRVGEQDERRPAVHSQRVLQRVPRDTRHHGVLGKAVPEERVDEDAASSGRQHDAFVGEVGEANRRLARALGGRRDGEDSRKKSDAPHASATGRAAALFQRAGEPSRRPGRSDRPTALPRG